MADTQQNVVDVTKFLKDSKEFLLSANSVLGIAGYKFISITRASLDAQSDITDYQLETGDFLQNFIANRPFILTIEGRISELYFEDANNDNIVSDVAKTTRKAFGIANTVSTLTDQVKSTLDAANSGDSLQNIGANALDVYASVQNNIISNTEVEKAVRFFLALRAAKQTISVTTPFGVYNSMGIQQVKFDVENTSNHSANFMIQLKHIDVKKATSQTAGKSVIDQAQQYIESEIKDLQEGAKKVFNSLVDLF